MCLYPTLITNPKYKPTRKNGWQPPPVKDERVKYVPIGCTKCIECMKQRARNWQVRLLEDIRTNKNGKFICLTFNNESYAQLLTEVKEKLQQNDSLNAYDIDNSIATLAMRRFLERWRKKYKKSLRHWVVTELGHTGTEHLHLHGIIWTDQSMEAIESKWQYGHVWKGKQINRRGKIYYENYVSENTISYMVKYMVKVDIDHKFYKQIILTSPGIGRGYNNRPDAIKNKYAGTNTIETYRTRTGHKISMPIYWRNKIYSEHEREQLWLHKLDRQERWVCGERVDISKSEEAYYKLLEWHRARNKRLGYGDNEKTWSQEQYEIQRRALKQEERIKAFNKSTIFHEWIDTRTGEIVKFKESKKVPKYYERLETT